MKFEPTKWVRLNTTPYPLWEIDTFLALFWYFFVLFLAYCGLWFEDDDDDGSVNHQKSSHVDMTNDHLQDNNGQTEQVNHSIV